MTEELLKSICKTPSGIFLRPFAPNPAWKTASCFFIGENPATDLTSKFSSFDEYWHALTVNPELFNQRYGTQHKGKTTKTTKQLRYLTEMLSEHNCLTTNVCWYPAKRFKRVPLQERKQGPGHLKMLIEFCKPKVLFFHGAEPVKVAERLFGVALDRFAAPESQCITVFEMKVFAYHHFSRRGVLESDVQSDLRRFSKQLMTFL